MAGPRAGSGASFLERARLRRRAPLLASVTRALQVGPGLSLLDLGGGTGAISESVGFGAREIVVLDPSPRKLRAGGARRPNVEFVEGQAERLPFAPHRFGRIVSTMAYHHFLAPDLVAAEVHRVLTVDGRWVLSDVDPEAPLGRRLRWLEHRLFRRAHNFEPRASVRSRLSAHGLTVVSEETVGPFYVMTAEQKEGDARPPAASRGG